MDDLRRAIRRAVEQSIRTADLVRRSGMAEYDIVSAATPGGVNVVARCTPRRREQMATIHACEVRALLPFKDEGLVLNEKVLSVVAIEEFLDRLFRYARCIEAHRTLCGVSATVAIRGLSYFSGVYRFVGPPAHERCVEFDDLYTTDDGHPLMAAALGGGVGFQLRGGLRAVGVSSPGPSRW